MNETYTIGVDSEDSPGKLVVTTITFGTQIHDQVSIKPLDNRAPIPAPMPPFLDPTAPGYGILARAIHEMLGTIDGGAPLGPHNRVAAFNSIVGDLDTIAKLTAIGHMPRLQMGQGVINGAVHEILHQHDYAWEPEWIGEFIDLRTWLESAGQVLSGSVPLICIDIWGRRCVNPADFLRASKDGAFPVRYFYTFREKPWARRPVPSPVDPAQQGGIDGDATQAR